MKKIIDDYSPILEGIEVEDLKEKVRKEKPSPSKMHSLKQSESN
jgi:hypothetical protein